MRANLFTCVALIAALFIFFLLATDFSLPYYYFFFVIFVVYIITAIINALTISQLLLTIYQL